MWNSCVSDSPETCDYCLFKDYQHLNVMFKQIITHSVCFGFLRLVYTVLSVSLECRFVIAPSVLSNVYLILALIHLNTVGFLFLFMKQCRQFIPS